MRIDSREPGEEGRTRIALVPETVDDLWHLSHVLEPDDFVSGDTTRRVRRDDDDLRDTGGQREPMSVTLTVAACASAARSSAARARTNLATTTH